MSSQTFGNWSIRDGEVIISGIKGRLGLSGKIACLWILSPPSQSTDGCKPGRPATVPYTKPTRAPGIHASMYHTALPNPCTSMMVPQPTTKEAPHSASTLLSILKNVACNLFNSRISGFFGSPAVLLSASFCLALLLRSAAIGSAISSSSISLSSSPSS